MTTYVILSKDRDQAPDWWIEVARVEAHDRRRAVAQYIHDQEDGGSGGTFVAVPERSWREINVAVETQTRLTFR